MYYTWNVWYILHLHIPPPPVYRDDMPRKLPAIDLIVGVAGSILENVRHWVHLGFVALMWIFFVPICICKCATI